MRFQIINGPNLNLLGLREPDIYGTLGFEEYLSTLRDIFPGTDIDYFQSNIEGELINKIHEVGFDCDGIVLNAGAYTHYSIAILDAIKAVNLPCVEVHISKVEEREDFRQISYIRLACVKTITGHGTDGYIEAIKYLIK